MTESITVLRQRSRLNPDCRLPRIDQGDWRPGDVIRCEGCGRHFVVVDRLMSGLAWKRVTRTRARWHARRRFLRLPRSRFPQHTDTEGITKL